MNALPLPEDGPERLLQHADALRRLARRLVRDDAEADDLVQETWTSVLEKPRAHEPAAGWKRWLFGVARNLARERRRSEGRRARRELTAARPEATSPGTEIVEQLETFRVLADELSRLEEPYRSTLYRRYFEGHSNERIAADDGIAEPSVRSRVSRGLVLLRERLERRESHEPGGWIVLLRRIAREEPERALPSLPFVVLSGAALLMTGLIVVALLQTRGATRGTDEQAALSARSGADAASASALADARLEDAAGSTRVTMAPGPVSKAPSLQLLDLRTEEPLSGFDLRLGTVGGAPARNVSTRADGSVPLDAVPGAFDVALTLIDDPRLDVLRRAHSGSRSFAWTLPMLHFAEGSTSCIVHVAVGPRFEVDFGSTPSAPLAALHAELLASDEGSLRASSTAPVREPLVPGGLPWVRFLDEATYLGGAPPYVLRVCDEGGLLCGETEVTQLVGAQRDPLHVELLPRGALDVRVRDDAGRPCPARLALLHAGYATVHLTADAGDASFRWIPADAVEIRVEAEGLEPLVVPARIVAGTTVPLDVAVKRPRGAGHIAGRALVRAPLVRFDIENAATHERREAQGTSDADSAVFDFAGVPAGRWLVRAHAPGIWRWSPRELDVMPPALDLALAPLPSAAARPIKLRAFDERTDDRIDHFAAELGCDGPDGESQTKTTGFGNLVFESVPQDAALAWTIDAEGYLPAQGDRSAIEHRGEMDAIRVKLARGWQRAVEVRDATAHGPLQGVRVIVDGAPAGETDASGELTLRRDAAPRRIEVDFPGWHLSGGTIEPGGRWSTAPGRKITAVLER